MLGVVEKHGLEGEPLPFLARSHRSPERIEAIGLGRGAGTGIDRDDDARIAFRDRGEGHDGVGIVGIDAHEDAVSRILPLAERVAQHRCDHLGFSPGGDEDGDGSGLFRRRQGGCRHARVSGINGEIAPIFPCDEDHVHEQIVDAADPQADHGEKQQFAMNRLQPSRQRLAQAVVPLLPVGR